MIKKRLKSFIWLFCATILALNVQRSASAQTPLFELHFSDAVNTGANPAPYDIDAQFSLIQSGYKNQIRIDVTNNSGTWLDSLGFNLPYGITLSNYVLSGTGVSGYSAASIAGKNLSAYGSFNNGFTLSGPNGGHLSSKQFTVICDTAYNSFNNYKCIPSANASGWFGSAHCGSLNSQPTCWVACKKVPSYALAVTEKIDSGNTCASSSVTFTITVTNAGSGQIQNINVQSGLLGIIDSGLSLLAGASKTYTIAKTYATGSYSDTVKVSGTSGYCNSTSASSTPASFTIGACPSSSVTVTVNQGPYCSGSSVTYTYVVTNATGNKLTNVIVTDSNADLGTIGTIASLLSGNSTTLTKTINPTHSEASSAVTVSSTNWCNAKVITTATTPAVTVGACSIGIVKSATPTNVCSNIGSVVNYGYTVTNSGSFPVTNVKVTDNVLGVIGTINQIAPGAADSSLSKSTSVSQSVTNVATAQGTFSTVDQSSKSATSNAVTVSAVNCSLSMTVKASKAAICSDSLNNKVTYAYSVTNGGSAPIAGIKITDDDATLNAALSSAPAFNLPAGGSYSVTVTVAPSSTVGGGTSKATGTGLNSAPVSTPATSTPAVKAGTCDLALSVTSDQAAVCSDNNAVNYTYVVTNPGSTTIAGIHLTDSNPDLNAALSSFGAFDLPAGGQKQVAVTINPTHPEAASSSTATGAGISGDAIATTGATPALDVENCQISLSVSTDLAAVCSDGPNNAVTYSYLVKNAGTAPLTNVTVTDSSLGAIGTLPTLQPNETHAFTFVLDPTQPTTPSSATATASGLNDTNAKAVTASASTPTVNAGTCDLALSVTSDQAAVCSDNNAVNYAYSVTNPGSTPIAGIHLTDANPDLNAALSNVGSFDLPAGGQKQIAVTINPTHPEAASSATATGTGITSASVTATGATPALDVETCQVALSVSTDLAAVCSDGPTHAVTYSYLVKNAGTAPLTNVTVTDSSLGAIGTLPTLQPNETHAFTLVQTPTQPTTPSSATATASGLNDTNAKAVTASASTPTVNAGTCDLALSVTSDQTAVCSDNNAVNYTYAVTNSGSTPIAGIHLTDANPDLNAALSSVGSFDLPAGGQKQITVTINPTHPEAASSAKATGAGITGDAIATTGATPAVNEGSCSISVTKVADKAKVCPDPSPATKVTYTYVVTNNGALPLANVKLFDDHLNWIGGTDVSPIASLAPGASQTLTATANLNATTVNIVTATANAVSGKPVTAAQATATVNALAPTINYRKVEALSGAVFFGTTSSFSRYATTGTTLTQADLSNGAYASPSYAISYAYNGYIPHFPELGHFGGTGEPKIWAFINTPLLSETTWDNFSIINDVAVLGLVGTKAVGVSGDYIHRLIFDQPFDGPDTARNYQLTQLVSTVTPIGTTSITFTPQNPIWIGAGAAGAAPNAGDMPSGWMSQGMGQFVIGPNLTTAITVYGQYSDDCGTVTPFHIHPDTPLPPDASE